MYEITVNISYVTPQGGAISFSLSKTWRTTTQTRVTMTHPHRKKVNLDLHQVKHNI